jgi:hypothetical protein
MAQAIIRSAELNGLAVTCRQSWSHSTTGHASGESPARVSRQRGPPSLPSSATANSPCPAMSSGHQPSKTSARSSRSGAPAGEASNRTIPQSRNGSGALVGGQLPDLR